MNEHKPILAIETSEKLCGVCLYFSSEKYFESNVFLKNSHSEMIFQSVENLLKVADVSLSEVKEIAVSSGPGSFTGLRIGFSAAKGLAFGANLSIVSVPTFEALALQISDYFENGTEIIIAQKVNSDEVYYAKVKIIENDITFLDKLKVRKISTLNKKYEDVVLVGNIFSNTEIQSNRKIISIGSPSPKYIAKWCELYGEKNRSIDYDYIEPNYLKNFIVKNKANV